MMGSWEFLQYQPNYFQNKGCKSEMVMELVMEVRRDLYDCSLPIYSPLSSQTIFTLS